MSDYPRAFELEPIGEWPGQQTEHRQTANFRSPAHRDYSGKWVPAQRVKLSKTMSELATELEQIGGTAPRLAIAVSRDDLRLNGRLRAGARPWHPGVVLSFDSPRGVQRYPSDQYTHWEDNLRAIVLTLNAMRGIERWGVGDVRGSYLALESGIAVPSTPFDHEPASVRRWLLDLLDRDDPGFVPSGVRSIVRAAQRATHPDTGGDAETFRLVQLAESYLREAGEL